MAVTKEKSQQNTNNKDLHLIPQNTEAEEAVLGAILVNPVVITKVVEGLKPESFYKPAHRYVYEAMLQLFNSNERIDIVSVSNVLDYNSKLETVGGRPFINDLALNAISTANIEYYAKIIQEKAIKRALINAGSEIVSFGYDVNPIDQSLDQAEKLIFDIAHVICELSSGMTLKAGTIIATGTPAGAGMGFVPPKFLKPGDVVTCRIQGIGEITNTVR